MKNKDRVYDPYRSIRRRAESVARRSKCSPQQAFETAIFEDKFDRGRAQDNRIKTRKVNKGDHKYSV